jgi:hypothetical protein
MRGRVGLQSILLKAASPDRALTSYLYRSSSPPAQAALCILIALKLNHRGFVIQVLVPLYVGSTRAGVWRTVPVRVARRGSGRWHMTMCRTRCDSTLIVQNLRGAHTYLYPGRKSCQLSRCGPCMHGLYVDLTESTPPVTYSSGIHHPLQGAVTRKTEARRVSRKSIGSGLTLAPQPAHEHPPSRATVLPVCSVLPSGHVP